MGLMTPELPAAAGACQRAHSPAAAAAAVGASEMMAAGSCQGELGVQAAGHAGLASHAVQAGRVQQVWQPVPGLVRVPEVQLLLTSLQTVQHHETCPLPIHPPNYLPGQGYPYSAAMFWD